MTAYFIVRAQVENATVRDNFHRWYQDEHLPETRRRYRRVGGTYQEPRRSNRTDCQGKGLG